MMDNQTKKGAREVQDAPVRQEPQGRNASEELLVVGIGASAGGLKALEAFFTSLTDTEGMAFVVIVHLSPEHESQMAELLQQHTSMHVAQVNEPVEVRGGHVYVIPPQKNLSMSDGHIHLSERTRYGRSPIDLFFRTLADTHGSHAVALVLSGTGSDGTVGLGQVKENGGLTLAQKPDEAEYDAMPRSAVATGHVDLVLPVAELAVALQDYRRKVGQLTLTARGDALSANDTVLLAKILAHLRARTGHDFTHYKHATTLRRLSRRLQLTGRNDLAAYEKYIRQDNDEVHHLLKDLLLTVTSFFRDPEAFATLEKDVIPELVAKKAAGEAVRAWVCGCATGEEAYTVAMLLIEEAERQSVPIPTQVFASDISGSALRTAREGLYREAIVSDVSSERLSRFFVEEPGCYRVKQEVREAVVFAAHNLLQDPPFSRLDLISCRNVLIYLDRGVHRRIFELCHYALEPGGYLFLGNAESVNAPELFRTVDKRCGLYQRKVGRGVIRPAVSPPSTVSRSGPAMESPDAHSEKHLDVEALHRTLLISHAPPSVIVNADDQVVHSLGGGEAYLTFSPGRPTQDILKVVREEFRLELRSALYRAFRKADRTRSRPIEVRVDGTVRHVQLLVEPITIPAYADDHVHVLFLEVDGPARRDRQGESETGSVAEQAESHSASDQPEPDAMIRQLEDELDHLKEQLQTTTEEHEVAAEEMTASNEEMQSINEELRSMAEELETSKEELQSVNEELLALNDELESRIGEVNEFNSDLQNLMSATEIATIFLDRNLNIRRCTPQVEELFDVGGIEAGRPAGLLTHQLGLHDLVGDAARVLRELTMIEREVQHAPSKKWYLVRYRPYHSVEGTIDGVVITLVDITAKKVYDEQLEALIETLEALLATRAEQIKRLVSELVLSEQNERQRIAQLLHDDLQQLLYAFQIRIGTLKTNLSKEQAARLEQATELIDRAISVARTLTVDLSPPVLKGDDLVGALEWLALRMEEMHQLRIDLDAEGKVPLPRDLRTLVYQLVRELLFNVVKHAGVSRARVKLLRKENELVLHVEDQGSGFDMEAAQKRLAVKPGGFGLESVRQRLDLFGGRLEMDAAPGEGTRATFYVPMVDETPRHLTEVGGNEAANVETDQ